MNPTESWLESERKCAHDEGVTHPENYPYLLNPDTATDRGVLLIHGFGASPRELRPLADRLRTSGVIVAGIRLPGHGTTPQDLQRRRADQWLQSAVAAYQALAAQNLKISIGGLSTGALIALHIAASHPAEKLLLLAPFLRLRHRLAPFAAPLSLFIAYQHRPIAEHEQAFYYAERPLKGVAQINRLLRRLPVVLPQIRIPILVLTSSGDATIAKGTAQQLYEQLGSRNKRIHCYGDQVPHVLTSVDNPEVEDVLRRCVSFLAGELQP